MSCSGSWVSLSMQQTLAKFFFEIKHFKHFLIWSIKFTVLNYTYTIFSLSCSSISVSSLFLFFMRFLCLVNHYNKIKTRTMISRSFPKKKLTDCHTLSLLMHGPSLFRILAISTQDSCSRCGLFFSFRIIASWFSLTFLLLYVMKKRHQTSCWKNTI